MLCGRVELCHVGLSRALLFRCKNTTNVLREYLSELDAPLVKTVDVVKEAFNSDTMLVESQELTAVVGIEATAE